MTRGSTFSTLAINGRITPNSPTKSDNITNKRLPKCFRLLGFSRDLAFGKEVMVQHCNLHAFSLTFLDFLR